MNPIDETDDTEAPESAFSPLPKLNFYRPSYRSPERAEIVRDSAEIAIRLRDFFSSVTLSIPFDTLKQKKESSSLDFLITFDDFSNPQNPQEPQWATLKPYSNHSKVGTCVLRYDTACPPPEAVGRRP